MDLKEIGCEAMDWIYIAQDRTHLQAGVIVILMILEGRKFIDQLIDHELLKGDCTSWY
jgi:hypothetical protein